MDRHGIDRRGSGTSLALILGMACALAPAVAAAATEPALSFRPAKSWYVGTAPTGTEVSTGSGLVCSVQTEFNNGFIVKFGGSEKWVETMVIDFRQDSFSPGDKYEVQLSVPGVAQETVSASAGKSNVLVMDLRRKKDLYHAMRDSAVFDLKLEHNEFRFYLSGFKDPAHSFERCMAGGDPAAPAAAEPRQAEALINESIALEEQEKSGKVAVVEIKPEDPRPVVEAIPYTETRKIGPDEVSKTEVIPGEAPAPADAPDTDEPALTAKQGDRRLSEILAEDIAENPEIADVQIKDIPAPEGALAPPPPAPAPVEPVEAAQAGPEPEPAALAEIQEEIAAPAAAPAVAEPAAMSGETIERLRQMAAAQLGAPPELEQPPVLDGDTVVQAEVPAPAPVQTEMAPAPEAPVVEEIPAAETDTAAALLEQPEQSLPPASKAEMAPVTDGAAPAPAAPADLTEAPVAPETAEAAPAPQVPPKSEPIVHKHVTHMEADLTGLGAVEPSAPHAIAREDSDMARKIGELERALGEMQRENTALNDELKMAIRESADEATSISSENWNLERATMRFNEAERQIRTLGEQIQKERAQCSMEKKDLQSQLFDPQITQEQQLARLAELEQKLAAAEAQLESERRRNEERLRLLESSRAVVP